MISESNAPLVLWDVDYTLVDPGGLGYRAFGVAFSRLFGRELVHRAPTLGRTDRAIILDILDRNGVADPLSHVDAYRQAMEESLDDGIEYVLAHGKVLPGVVDALAAVGELDGVVQSVLTGNLRPIAETKLAAFGLDRFLDVEVGAFGWAHTERAKLVDVARTAARQKYGRSFDGAATVLVGDTPLDIEAAVGSGASVVSVATGKHSAEDLLAAGASVVLPDVTDAHALIEAIKVASGTMSE